MHKEYFFFHFSHHSDHTPMQKQYDVFVSYTFLFNVTMVLHADVVVIDSIESRNALISTHTSLIILKTSVYNNHTP